MASYVVMKPEDGDAEQAVFVRDGFHFWAFVLPVIWLLWHRLWFEAVAALLAIVGLGLLLDGLAPLWASPPVSLAVGLWFGLESPALRIAALRRRGFSEWGVVEAGDVAEAEIRHAFALEDDADMPEEPVRPPVTPAMFGRPAAAGPALGLLAYPGR